MASSEEDPLLSDTEEDPERQKKKPRSYLKDQIVSCLVLVFYVVAMISRMPLMSQYIHARFTEIYSNNSNTSNFTNSQGAPLLDQNANGDPDSFHLQIQQATSMEILKITVCMSLPSAIVNTMMGSYSDHVGRKLLFLLPLFGSICEFVVICLVVRLHLNLNFILLAVLLEGCTGGFSTFVLGSMAYAADVTPTHERRTLAMVVRDSSVSVAIAGGSLLTGVLIDKFGFFYPCIASIALLVLSTILVSFGLSETVKRRQMQSLSPVMHMKKVFAFYVNKDKKNSSCLFILFVIIYSVLNIALNGKYSVETLYQLGVPFSWDSLTIGYYGAASTVILTVSGLVAIKACCVKEEVLPVVGFLMAAGSLVLEGLAKNDIMMFSVPLVASISSVCNPVIRSIMSRMAGPEQQGALFSSVATVDTLCAAIGGAVFTALYSATVGTMRGLVFLVLAGLMVIAFLINFITILKFPLISWKHELLVETTEKEVRPAGPSIQHVDINSAANTLPV